MKDSQTEKWVALAEGAMRLRMPYQDAHRQLLTGRLKGERRGSRWYVTVQSVEALRRARDADQAVAV